MPEVLQTSFAGGELTPELEGRVDLAKYKIGASLIKNMVVRKFGSVSRRPGTTIVNVDGDADIVLLSGYNANPDSATIVTSGVASMQSKHRMIPFKFSAGDTFILVFDNSNMYVVKTGASPYFVEDPLSAGDPYPLAHPYNSSDFQGIKYAQDADNVYLTHPDYAPRVITRVADDNWTITSLTFTAPTPPVNFVAQFYYQSAANNAPANSKTVKYAVTSVDVYGNESELSNVSSEDLDSAWPLTSEVRMAWDKTAGAIRYNVYKNSRNYWGYVGTVSDDDVPASQDLPNDPSFTDDRIEENAGEGPPEWPTAQFGATDEYPSALAIFEQRMMYASTNDQPSTVFGSQTGDFQNLSVSFPLKDTDAIEATISSGEFNKIQHLVPLRELVVLTEGAEWVMSHGDNVDALSPTSVQFKVQGNRGSSGLRPIVVGDSVLFVERDDKTVRDLSYSFESDAMAGSDLTVLAPHLFEGRTIKGWAYATTPDSILWVVTSDGALLSLTYNKAQDVWAWARHDVSSTAAGQDDRGYAGYPLGYVVGVASTGSETYIMTFRYSAGAGGDNFYVLVEKLNDNATTDPHVSPVPMDCSMVYNGSSTTNPFGSNTAALGLVLLIHGGGVTGDEFGAYLEVVADGDILTYQSSGTPAAGEYFADNDAATPLLLGTAAADVTMGVGYTSEFKSLPLVHADQRGAPSYGDRNTVSEVTLRVYKSRGAQVGPDEDNLVDIPWEAIGGESIIAPKSKDFTVPFLNCRTTQPRVYIKQSEPSPFTLLSFSAEVQVGR